MTPDQMDNGRFGVGACLGGAHRMLPEHKNPVTSSFPALGQEVLNALCVSSMLT
jgi:hypothetical protein